MTKQKLKILCLVVLWAIIKWVYLLITQLCKKKSLVFYSQRQLTIKVKCEHISKFLNKIKRIKNVDIYGTYFVQLF